MGKTSASTPDTTTPGYLAPGVEDGEVGAVELVVGVPGKNRVENVLDLPVEMGPLRRARDHKVHLHPPLLACACVYEMQAR